MADGGGGRARFIPPRPPGRPARAGPGKRWRLARRSLFAALKDTLYNAWMAEVKTPFRDGYLINQPALLKKILTERPADFPKARAIGGSLGDLLGDSVFVTNGETWARQRRIIDPAFEGGRLRDAFPAMVAAAEGMADRLDPMADGRAVEMEFETAHAAADVIFRTLFSAPITTPDAQAVFHAFRRYQAAAPVLSPLDILGAPGWIPRFGRRAARREGRAIRALLAPLVARRAAAIAQGAAPDDLATKIMTATDPITGDRFDAAEMLDQVAIFFLAGHETSASALAWALYLLANDPAAQARARAEADAAGALSVGALRRSHYTRNVFRETLRLFPPVPMMVRENTAVEHFRNRKVAKMSLLFLSPWHLHRHERLWRNPGEFDPDRWERADEAAARRSAYMPFSAGARVCPGAGFAMMEGGVLLATLLRRFEFAPSAERPPEAVTHLTLRSATGIWLKVSRRRV